MLNHTRYFAFGIGGQSIAISVCVCMCVCVCVCPLAYQEDTVGDNRQTDIQTDKHTLITLLRTPTGDEIKTTRLNFTKFSIHVTCGRGSVLL